MGTITREQLKKLHTIRNQYAEYRDNDAWHDLIEGFTNGRTRTSKELSLQEAKELIESLDESNRRMRNKVYAICLNIGWFQTGQKDDLKINWGVIDNFLKTRGVVKKPLRKCSHKELAEVVSQFERIQKRGYDNELKAILKDSGISISNEPI